MFKTLLLAISFLFSFSTFAYDPITKGELQQLLKEFQYKDNIKDVKEGRKSNRRCGKMKLSYKTNYPQTAKDVQVDGVLYLPKGVQNAPFVFLIPPVGGQNMLDRNMAKTFCKNNIAALILTTDFSGVEAGKLRPIEDQDHVFRRITAAIKAGMAYAKQKPEISNTRFGLFGVSLGGILGAFSYGVIDDLAAATFVVNGGDVPYILAYSKQKKVVKIKKLRKRAEGFTSNKQYEAYLRKHTSLDPLHVASRVDPDSVKLFLSTRDKNVPTNKQLELYEAFGKPKNTKFIRKSHVGTVINVLFGKSKRQRIVNFYKQRL